MKMRKKAGWIWIIGAILLFIINFVTLGNQSFVIASWASMLGKLIGFIVCPILLLIGIAILILGKSK